MDALLFATGAVLPIVLLVALGYLLKQVGMIPETMPKQLNRLVFRVLLPCHLFLNIYRIDDLTSIEPGYILYVLGFTLVFLFLALPAVLATTKVPGERGALSQAIFRSNYALIGIPLATSLFGEEGAIVATLLSAFIIPLFNILAVITLTVFGDGGRVSIKRILLGIVKNPLILSIAIGCLVLGVRALLVRAGVAFRLSDITPVFSVAEQLSRCATPIALLSLGAQFSFSAIPTLKRQIVVGTLLRTLVLPILALGLAYLLGCFRGAHFAAFVAVFATPVAVSSVPMAQEMGADTRLAGQLVVFSTLVSGITIFLYSLVLRAIGIF